MQLKKPLRRTKVSNVIGNKFSNKEIEFNTKHNIYMPENTEMVITKEGPLNVMAFERRLKKIDPKLFIHVNKRMPEKEEPFGHIIRYYNPDVPEKYDFLIGVGIGGHMLIPAQSQFEHYFNKEKNLYETRMQAIGWVPAEEAVIKYLVGRKHGS